MEWHHHLKNWLTNHPQHLLAELYQNKIEVKICTTRRLIFLYLIELNWIASSSNSMAFIVKMQSYIPYVRTILKLPLSRGYQCFCNHYLIVKLYVWPWGFWSNNMLCSFMSSVFNPNKSHHKDWTNFLKTSPFCL